MRDNWVVTFNITLPQGVYFAQESKQRFTFSSIEPGQYEDLDFSFTPNKNVGSFIELTIILLCFVEISNSIFLLVTWFWEKPTFRSKTRFAPHLTISSRLASFLVHFEQLFFGYISLLKLEQGWGKHIQVVVGQLLQSFDGTIKTFMLTLT